MEREEAGMRCEREEVGDEDTKNDQEDDEGDDEG